MIRNRSLRWVEYALLMTGVFLLGVMMVSLLRYQLFQIGSHLPEQWQAVCSRTPVAAGKLNRKYLLARNSGGHVGSVQVTGRLEIARLGMSVLMVEGDEEEGLSVAAVHLAGSARIGGWGNAVIAGHRDSAFWPLRNVKLGDLIRVRGPASAHCYTVRSIRIVSPDDVSVLENGTGSVLTLVTCYPFRHIGSSPRRFVIQAQLVS